MTIYPHLKSIYARNAFYLDFIPTPLIVIITSVLLLNDPDDFHIVCSDSGLSKQITHQLIKFLIFAPLRKVAGIFKPVKPFFRFYPIKVVLRQSCGNMAVKAPFYQNDRRFKTCLRFKVCLHDFLPQGLYGLQAAL